MNNIPNVSLLLVGTFVASQAIVALWLWANWETTSSGEAWSLWLVSLAVLGVLFVLSQIMKKVGKSVRARPRRQD